MPWAIPTVSESTTWTGMSTRSAARRAASTVPESADEMWMEITDSNPRRWAAR